MYVLRVNAYYNVTVVKPSARVSYEMGKSSACKT